MGDKEVKIKVKADKSGVTVHPDPVVIKTKQNDQAVWICDDGNFTVTFDKEQNPDTGQYSPFEGTRFSGGPGNSKGSGKAKYERKTRYHYRVDLTLADGTVMPTLDPDADVDDGGEPPNGRKKKKTKSGAKRKPAAKKRKPAGKKRKPAGKKRKPAGKRRKPAGKKRKPPRKRRKPAARRPRKRK